MESQVIYWAGDSTVQYNDISTYPQTGIGQVMHLYLKQEVQIRNYAKNGTSTKSFIKEGRLDCIRSKIKKGDFFFIQFGHNDEKTQTERGTNPEGDFRIYLREYIDTSREKEALPVLITPLYRRCFCADGLLEEKNHLAYPDTILEVAVQEKIPVINLCESSKKHIQKMGIINSKSLYMNLEAGQYDNYPEGKIDNTHLRYEGAVTFAGLLADGLRELGGVYADLLL